VPDPPPFHSLLDALLPTDPGVGRVMTCIATRRVKTDRAHPTNLAKKTGQ